MVHTVYYLPNRKQIWVSLTGGGQAAAEFEPVHFDLGELLSE